MNRKEKRGKRIKKIVEVATQLFLKQGYENTTIRQILKDSGFSTGSCYNLFKNKEDILVNVMMGFSSQVINLSKQIAVKFDDPEIGHSIAVATEKYSIMGSPALLNLYRSIWTVSVVQESILQHRAGNAQRILKNLRIELDFDDIYMRVLASLGIEKALIEAKIIGMINIKPGELWALQTRMLYASFGIPKKRTENTIEIVLDIMKNEGKKYKNIFIQNIVDNKSFLNGLKN